MGVAIVRRAAGDRRGPCGRYADCFLRGHAEELRWWLVGQEPVPSAAGCRAGACFLSFSKARRAASCSARFLVVPTPRAIALGAVPAASLTSTRKRLRWSGPLSAL